MNLIHFAPRRNRAVIPWSSPFDDLVDMTFEWPKPLTFRGSSLPRLDIEETEQDIIVTADVPGMNPEDIHVDVQDNMFTISGKHAEKEEDSSKKKYWHQERFMEFHRSFSLPARVDATNVAAKFMKNGTLKVTMPKLTEKSGQKVKIEVEK